MGEKEPLR